MNDNNIRVTFLPDGKSAVVKPGTSIVRSAIEAGVQLIAPCNGKGTCGKCKVHFQQGVAEPNNSDKQFFDSTELYDGWRLACMHSVVSETTLWASAETLGKVDFGPSLEHIALAPPSQKLWFRLDTIEGVIPAWEDLLANSGGPVEVLPTLTVLRTLSQLEWQPGLEITLLCRAGLAVDLEIGDTRLSHYGLAFDVGTTTVAGALLDLNTGEELASFAALNRQSVHGSDVMSRLTAIVEDPSVLPILQQRVLETIEEIIDNLISQAQVQRDQIYEVTFVGNSCMHHLLLGLNPITLAMAPYNALTLEPVTFNASEIGLHLPQAAAYCLPNVASFIGGDALGAVLATGLHRSSTIKCLVDIGTNGEIILGSADRIIACSTPAGPAFEGACISCGMIASEGAINKVKIDEQVAVETVGNVKPKGLAGSGLIDAGAALLRAGLMDERGKFRSQEDAARFSPPKVTNHLIKAEKGYEFLLARSYGKDLKVTQRDIRELQLAKGVIFAGIESLKIEMGIGNDQIDELYLAGTFGSYLNIASAREIGLIPPLPEERVRAVGNAAHVGAKMCLLSVEARQEAEALAKRIQHVELPLRKDFQDIFADAMLFPSV